MPSSSPKNLNNLSATQTGFSSPIKSQLLHHNRLPNPPSHSTEQIKGKEREKKGISPNQCPACGTNSELEFTPTTPVAACSTETGLMFVSPPSASTGCVSFPPRIDELKNSPSTAVVAKYSSPERRNPGLEISVVYRSTADSRVSTEVWLAELRKGSCSSSKSGKLELLRKKVKGR